MHEGPAARSLLNAVLANVPKRGKSVKKINVIIGAMSGIEAECLRMYMSEMSKGTIAENAVLEVRVNNADVICPKCGKVSEFDLSGPLKVECEGCGGSNTLQGGEGVFLESIEVEK